MLLVELLDNTYYSSLEEAKYGAGGDGWEAVKHNLLYNHAVWTSNGWMLKTGIDLSYCGLTKLPLIYKVEGGVRCSYNKLTSLLGSPVECKFFNCSFNLLKTLDGGPLVVRGDYYCQNNQLESIYPGPVMVKGKMHFQNNPFGSKKSCAETTL